jgi:uncharacterized membrane protein HdeD (DUF308 family)
MTRIADHWPIMWSRGLASFGLAGLLVLVRGWSSVTTLAIAFGIWALIDGLGSLAFVFHVRGVQLATYVGRGCLGIAMGAIALALARTSTAALYATMAAWAIGTGALEMAFVSRRWFVLPGALGFMLVGAVALSFGMSLLPFPLATAKAARRGRKGLAALDRAAGLES